MNFPENRVWEDEKKKKKKVGAAEHIAAKCSEMRFVAGEGKKALQRKAVVLKLDKMNEVYTV